MKGHMLAALLCAGCQGVEANLLLTVPAPDLAMTPECTSGVLGGTTICASEADFKGRAATACAGDSRALTTFTPYEPCGNNQFRFVKYECCPQNAGGTCRAESQGGSTSCKGEREWYNAAVTSCALTKQVPMQPTFRESCADMGGLYRYVKYLCCPQSPMIQ